MDSYTNNHTERPFIHFQQRSFEHTQNPKTKNNNAANKDIIEATKMAWEYIKKGFLLVFADILSLITVALCLIQKLPQIRDLYGYKSARGR